MKIEIINKLGGCKTEISRIIKADVVEWLGADSLMFYDFEKSSTVQFLVINPELQFVRIVP